MGAFSGVDKFARIKSYKVSGISNQGTNSQQAILDAVAAAMVDYRAENAQGKAKYAIINLSSESAHLVANNGPLPVIDPWPQLLDQLAAAGIVLVHSAGNDPINNLADLTPPQYSATRPGLIVVGLSNLKNKRLDRQTTEGTSDALSVYAYAHYAVCATMGSGDGYELKTGTSGAAAIVSGVVSIMLAAGVNPASAKDTLQRISLSRKDGVASPNHANGVPIVALDFEIGCYVTNPTSLKTRGHHLSRRPIFPCRLKGPT